MVELIASGLRAAFLPLLECDLTDHYAGPLPQTLQGLPMAAGRRQDEARPLPVPPLCSRHWLHPAPPCLGLYAPTGSSQLLPASDLHRPGPPRRARAAAICGQGTAAGSARLKLSSRFAIPATLTPNPSSSNAASLSSQGTLQMPPSLPSPQ